MTVSVFGKPGCALCASAKDKLERLGVAFQSFDIEKFTEAHEGWRDDGSTDVLAAYSVYDHKIPLIRIDDMWFDYPSAMKYLKQKKNS